MTAKFLTVAVAATAMLVFSPSAADAGRKFLKGATVVETASFIGESDHTVSGKVSLVKKGEVYYLVFAKNFRFDGAPDPRLGFSNNDKFIPDSLFSGLNRDRGKQIYRLPASFDPSSYDEITIWCEKFSVPLAEAKF